MCPLSTCIAPAQWRLAKPFVRFAIAASLGLQKQRDQSTGIDQEPRISRSGGSGSKNNPEEQGAAEARIPRKQQGNEEATRSMAVGSFPGGKKEI